jgi:chemotaxis protein CheX
MGEIVMLFYNSLKDMLEQMAGINLELDQEQGTEGPGFKSLGLSSIITFAGRIKGRLLIDMEPAVGLQVAANIYGQEFSNVRDPLVMASISELNNIVSGDSTTQLNDRHGLGIRLAPPIVFTGSDVTISIPQLKSQTLGCKTEFGKVKINIAFEGGTV